MNDEYEILSHEEIENLKREADKHKNNPFIKSNSDEKLYLAITTLNKSIERLASVFEDVKQQILREQEEGEGPDTKMDEIMDQNKHIARALVSFGEKVETLVNKEQENQLESQPKNNDLDYQSSNYGQPSRPEVSRSKPEPQQPSQQFQQPQELQGFPSPEDSQQSKQQPNFSNPENTQQPPQPKSQQAQSSQFQSVFPSPEEAEPPSFSDFKKQQSQSQPNFPSPENAQQSQPQPSQEQQGFPPKENTNDFNLKTTNETPKKKRKKTLGLF